MELSIVLVILGLLVGGILAGQSLIRASELRSVGTEYQRYMTAIHTFRDKYFAIPGDMANATNFWGKDTTNCNSHSGTAATPGTCNGNGNGLMEPAAGGAGKTGELFQFWRQLQLAGLLDGLFSGIAGTAGGGADSVIGENVPASRLPGAGWSMYYLGINAGNANLYAFPYNNAFILGSYGAGSFTYGPSILRAEEAWNIDTKMDDGKPGTGKIMVRSRWGWGGTSCTTSASETDYNGDYNLSLSGKLCGFYFPQVL